ncbi:LPS assembly lipoprotein LptE [Sedimentitalea sp. XS_ASV28]|uniref:LPS assembly lipoprotein LptE n=1 Tax=Sedimentitalea sp. XS_ASV28 TaxID=3241296 RepID=UPI003512DF2E
MSLFDRRSLLLMPLALAACGFEPVYGPGGGGKALYGKVRVDAPDGVNTYYLVRRLEEQLGRAADPVYRLAMVLEITIQGQAITASGDITYYSVVGSINYDLIEIGSGRSVETGSVTNFTGYSATGNTAETLAAQRDARERLMVILADQVTRQLNATVDLAS